MKALYRTLPAFILLWVVISAQAPIGAQEGPQAPPAVIHEHPLVDPGVLEFIKVFGLGGMVFVIWLFDYRRQRGLEDIIKRYEETSQAHLAAFRDINDRNIGAFREAMAGMQNVAENAQQTAVLCAQVNSTLSAKVEQLIVTNRERHA